MKKRKLKLINNAKPKPKLLTSDITVLEAALDGDKELVLFFLNWLKLGRNATKAYQQLHPKVSYQVAAVLGCRMLKKVNIHVILESYGIGINTYLQQLSDGLKASVKKEVLSGFDDDGPVYSTIDEPDHKTRRHYHKALGELLGVEGQENMINNNIQINNSNTIDNLQDDELDDLIS